jgi:hypothetical protein
MSEAPRVVKAVSAYRNDKEEIISYLLADYLKNGELCREDSTISFFDYGKETYIFGFNMAKDVKDIRKNIASRFLHEGLVPPPYSAHHQDPQQAQTHRRVPHRGAAPQVRGGRRQQQEQGEEDRRSG